MIYTAPALTKKDFDYFYIIRQQIYENIIQDRGGNEDLVRFLLNRKNNFRKHAKLLPFLLFQDEQVIGRFVLIHDLYLKDYVQVAFFEALRILEPICNALVACIKEQFPEVPKLLIGLAGHLNYGAGILLNHFDEPPLYEFTYNPAYYKNYFFGLKEQRIVSFRLPISGIMNSPFFKSIPQDINDIKVRCLDKNRFRQELALYTALNNRNFVNHPYWSKRSVKDDYEYFMKFKPFVEPEYLLFAEKDGRTVGFLFWTPDFNEWLAKDHNLGPKQLKKLKRRESTHLIRYMEIGVDWDHRHGKVTTALLFAFFNILKRYDFQELECSFIMEGNVDSINLAKRFIKRITGKDAEPYRRWAIYEGNLEGITI